MSEQVISVSVRPQGNLATSRLKHSLDRRRLLIGLRRFRRMWRLGIGMLFDFCLWWILLIGVDRLYPGVMGGIFIDRTWMECGVNNLTARVYRLLSDNTKRKHPGLFTVLNSGESISACFEEMLWLNCYTMKIAS